MILSRRVALDTVQLDSIDERIAIRGINIQAGKENIGADALYGGTGSRVNSRHRDSLDITVQFGLNIKRGGEDERAELLEKIVSWACRGGWLTTNMKPGRKIRVIAASLPGDGEALDWTKDYAIVFRAYGVPYWQETAESGGSASGSGNLSTKIILNGHVGAPIDVTYKQTSGGPSTAVTLTAGTGTGYESRFILEELNLADGETLEIDHPDEGDKSWLRIRIKSAAGVYRSALGCRTRDSSNDLIITPGTRYLQISKTGSGTLTAKAYGRYL